MIDAFLVFLAIFVVFGIIYKLPMGGSETTEEPKELKEKEGEDKQ